MWYIMIRTLDFQEVFGVFSQKYILVEPGIHIVSFGFNM